MENQKPRLAVLASRFPFPVEKGDKLRLYHQMKHLADAYDIYLFALTDESPTEEAHREVAQCCQKVFVYRDHRSRRNLRVIRHLKDQWPAQVRYFYSPEIHRRFLADFFTINADVIYCQLYRMVPYLEGIRAPKVLDVMDNFAAIANLHAQHSRKLHDRWFWRRESQLIQRYEGHVLKDFDHITVISERDARNLNASQEARVSIVRNGIDVSFFQSYPNRKTAPEYDIGFFGNLDYKPNREGVRYLIQEILPVLRQHHPHIKILIGGKGAENLNWDSKTYPEVSFHGWYDDIRTAYYAVRIFVVPLFLGSGMQNKVLEAMACGRPVICTSHVIQGMPMLREYARVADDPNEFRDQYEVLTENEEASQKQSATLSVLKNDLTWESQCSVLKQVLDDTRKNYGWNFARYH